LMSSADREVVAEAVSDEMLDATVQLHWSALNPIAKHAFSLDNQNCGQAGDSEHLTQSNVAMSNLVPADIVSIDDLSETEQLFPLTLCADAETKPLPHFHTSQTEMSGTSVFDGSLVRKQLQHQVDEDSSLASQITALLPDFSKLEGDTLKDKVVVAQESMKQKMQDLTRALTVSGSTTSTIRGGAEAADIQELLSSDVQRMFSCFEQMVSAFEAVTAENLQMQAGVSAMCGDVRQVTAVLESCPAVANDASLQSCLDRVRCAESTTFNMDPVYNRLWKDGVKRQKTRGELEARTPGSKSSCQDGLDTQETHLGAGYWSSCRRSSSKKSCQEAEEAFAPFEVTSWSVAHRSPSKTSVRSCEEKASELGSAQLGVGTKSWPLNLYGKDQCRASVPNTSLHVDVVKPSPRRPSRGRTVPHNVQFAKLQDKSESPPPMSHLHHAHVTSPPPRLLKQPAPNVPQLQVSSLVAPTLNKLPPLSARPATSAGHRKPQGQNHSQNASFEGAFQGSVHGIHQPPSAKPVGKRRPSLPSGPHAGTQDCQLGILGRHMSD